jgi:hypothetical protein
MWCRIDDGLADHPRTSRLIDLSDDPAAAFGLWVFVQALAARTPDDEGRVPIASVRRQGRLLSMSKERIDRAMDDLLQAGFWIVNGTMINIHDWTDYNLTSSQLNARREAGKARSKALRERRRTPKA